MCDRCRPKTGFVRKHTACHTKTDRGPDRGTGKSPFSGRRCKSMGEHQAQRIADTANVDQQNEKASHNIRDRHERNQFTCDRADPANTTEDHSCGQNHQHDPGNRRIHSKV